MQHPGLFRSYKDFTGRHTGAIALMLERLYKTWGLNDQTAFLLPRSEDFPILSDLYEIMEDAWQAYSYTALCGTSERVMLWTLEQNPDIRNILLYPDHNKAGMEANGRYTEIFGNHGCSYGAVLQPEHKDWNEVLQSAVSLSAEEHPQLVVAPDVWQFIAEKCKELKPDSLGSLEKDFPGCFYPSKTIYKMVKSVGQRCVRIECPLGAGCLLPGTAAA